MPSRTAPPAADAPVSFVIGELAARTGTSAETIRYYERVGVLPPARRRGNGRYRSYDTRDVERLRFVRRARALGFTVDEVRELLGLAHQTTASCAGIDAIARAHLLRVTEKIARLSALRSELERAIVACGGGLPTSECRILSALSQEDSSTR